MFSNSNSKDQLVTFKMLYLASVNQSTRHFYNQQVSEYFVKFLKTWKESNTKYITCHVIFQTCAIKDIWHTFFYQYNSTPSPKMAVIMAQHQTLQYTAGRGGANDTVQGSVTMILLSKYNFRSVKNITTDSDFINNAHI